MAELQKREKIMVGVAGGVLVAFLLYQFVFTKSEEPPAQARKVPSPNQSAAPAAVSVKSGKSDGEPHKASFAAMQIEGWGSDPFHEAYRLAVFDTAITDTSVQLDLKGIIWKGNQAFVLINDSILKKGDKLGDVKILDIKRERVICQKGKNTVTLFLDNEN